MQKKLFTALERFNVDQHVSCSEGMGHYLQQLLQNTVCIADLTLVADSRPVALQGL